MRALHEVVYPTGMLSYEWTVRDFHPIDCITSGVRLTAYSGEASDLPPEVLQTSSTTSQPGDALVPIHHVYGLDEIQNAHAQLKLEPRRESSSS